MADPFAAYHRAGRRMIVARVIPIAFAALAIAAGLALVPAAAPAAPPLAAPAADAPAIPAVDTLPEPADVAVATQAAEVPTAPTLAATGAPQWRIDIDTIGYQAEIDDCLWVRMDLGTHAPIVGAHNYCGGDVVLGMALGDSVTLSGVGLDGLYTVISARDARAGDNAMTATAGLGGTVILQTCYWGSTGAERLVALAPE